MRLNAEWTDDCCGKKDYDGDILSISTRYWPAGGSGMFFDPAQPELGLRHFDDGTRPSATSALILRGENEDSETIVKKDFEGDTFAEVALQVQVWAQEQMDKAEAALRVAFTMQEAKP